MAWREACSLGLELEQLRGRSALRQRRRIDAIDPEDATRVWVAGRELRNFCGNDYLGLRAHPALREAATDCMRRFGVGAGAAHLVTGHSHEHHALEEELAAFTHRERALLFSTGYMANLGAVSAFADARELVLADRLSHASLLDGARLSGARLRRYAHADAASAERLLAAADRPAALILTDGVFSMDGDVAPLAALASLARRHGAGLLVDDAHGIGVLGASGGGALEAAGLGTSEVPLLIGTLGKACGTFGAFVAGDAAVIDCLMQRARSYIYTTALPPAVAAASRAALRVIESESWRRERLGAHVTRWRAAAAALELPLLPSTTAIQPLIVGDSAAAMALSEALMARGFWVAAIRPPTVAPGSARLRITLSAAHRERDIDELAEALGALWRARGAP
jgi:8-amino-7-oxononanoate synthase